LRGSHGWEGMVHKRGRRNKRVGDKMIAEGRWRSADGVEETIADFGLGSAGGWCVGGPR
jgi:hypothetical protein